MFNIDSYVGVLAVWLPWVTAFLRHYRPSFYTSLKEFYNVGGYPFDHLVFFEKLHPLLDCSLVSSPNGIQSYYQMVFWNLVNLLVPKGLLLAS